MELQRHKIIAAREVNLDAHRFAPDAKVGEIAGPAGIDPRRLSEGIRSGALRCESPEWSPSRAVETDTDNEVED